MAEIARLDVILGGDTSGLTKAMRDAKGQLISFTEVSKAASQLAPFSKATASALQAAKSIEKLENVLAQLKLERVGVTGAKELAAYNNAIKATTSQIKSLESASISGGANIAKGFNKTYGAIRQVAQILPGIGIAGIFGLAFEAISEVVQEMDLFNSATQKAAQKTAELNAEFAKQGAGVATEVQNINSLFNVAKDLTQSTETRKNAIQELQKEYPGYLGNLNLENINSQEAANAVGKLAEALARKAKVQAISNLLTKENEKLLLAQTSSTLDNLNAIERFFGQFAKGGAFALSVASTAAENRGEKIKETQATIDSLIKSLNDLTKTQATNNDFQLLDPTKIAPIKEAKKVVIDLQKEINKLLRYPHALPKDITEQRPYDPVQIAPGITTLSEIDAKNALIKMRDILRQAGKQVFTNQGILTDVDLLNNDEVKKNFDKYKAGLLEIVGVVDTLGQAFQQVFTTLLSGGTHAFKALTQALTALLTKLVATVIEAALLSAILSAFTGGSSLITGGAGFKNILKQLLGGGLQFHAEGGVFTQPTRWGGHVLGDKPEALIPLDRLSQMMVGSNSQQPIVLNTRISGSDLLLIQNRAQLQAGRAYGGNFNRRN